METLNEKMDGMYIKQMPSQRSLNYSDRAADSLGYILIYLHLEAQIATDESDVQLRKGFNYAKGAAMESVADDARRSEERSGESILPANTSHATLFFPTVSSSIRGTQKPIAQNASAPRPLRRAAAFTAVFPRTS